MIMTGDAGGRLARNCLRAVKKNTPPELIKEIIIVDAGISPDFNHASEINKILKIFSGNVFVHLDDDTIVEPGWLKAMIDCAESDGRIGIVGCVMKNGRGKIVHTGSTIDPDFYGIDLNNPINEPRDRKYVCSAVMLIKRALVEEIGYFDESSFRKFYQDTDYCVRAHKAGFRVVCAHNASAVHLFGATVKKRADKNELHKMDHEAFRAKWEGSSLMPSLDIIEVTKRGVTYPSFACNIKCAFCYYRKSDNREHRPIEEMKAEMDRFRSEYGHDYVDITGGEPTVYKHITELVAYCRQIGLLPTIITNGQKPQIIPELIQNGLEDLLGSIHGYKEDCDAAMNKKGAFDTIVRTFESCRELDFTFRTNTTLLRYNYRNLPRLAEFLTDIRPRIVNFINSIRTQALPGRKRNKSNSRSTSLISLLLSKKRSIYSPMPEYG